MPGGFMRFSRILCVSCAAVLAVTVPAKAQVEDISEAIGIVQQIADLFGSKPDTNAEDLQKLNDVLKEEKQLLTGEKEIEGSVKALSTQLEQAEVAIVNVTAQKWDQYETALYDGPIGRYELEMQAWNAVIAAAPNHIPNVTEVAAHKTALDGLQDGLQNGITSANDYGGIVYAPMIEAVFANDSILGYEAGDPSNSAAPLLVQRRISYLAKAKDYFDIQLDETRDGTVAAQAKAWDASRQKYTDYLAKVDAAYLGTQHYEEKGNYFCPNNAGTVKAWRTRSVVIAKNADGTYSATLNPPGDFMHGICPSRRGAGIPKMPAADVTLPPDPQFVPVAPGIAHDWSADVAVWNNARSILNDVTKTAGLLDKSKAAIQTADGNAAALLQGLQPKSGG
jgi:hypothetical protein